VKSSSRQVDEKRANRWLEIRRTLNPRDGDFPLMWIVVDRLRILVDTCECIRLKYRVMIVRTEENCR
jgi:hypothetical protein